MRYLSWLWGPALHPSRIHLTSRRPVRNDEPPHWGYEAGDGPARWGSMDPAWSLCDSGRSQSPIDLTGAESDDLPSLAIHFPTDSELEVVNQAGVVNELDNGHTIQINAKVGEWLAVDGKRFPLVQFHFHAPSEHTLDGEHFPMEMHFVHQAEDGALAVAGVFVKEGAENPGIVPFWEKLAEAGTSATIPVAENVAELILPEEQEGIFHYVGSLTTPPCSEGVEWFVGRTPAEFSKEQIAAFTALYDHNNRPVQPLNDRELVLDDDPEITLR